MPDLSIVIVSYNTSELLMNCLHSLARVRDEAEFEVIVVDNASTDGSAEMVRTSFPDIRLIAQDRNLGFATGANSGMAAANSKLLFCLNPDTLVPRGTISKLCKIMDKQPGFGIAGCQLTGPDGQDQPSDFRFPTLLREFFNLIPEVKSFLRVTGVYRGMSKVSAKRGAMHEVGAISGAAFVIRREVWDGVDGFDREFFLYHEEIDLCQRVRQQGGKIGLAADCPVIHLGAAASGHRENRLPRDPVLSWRLTGMDRLWSKHRAGRPHRRWRSQTRALLGLRVFMIGLAGIIGRKLSAERVARIQELQNLRRKLRS